jgi:hypothetical protein
VGPRNVVPEPSRTIPGSANIRITCRAPPLLPTRAKRSKSGSIGDDPTSTCVKTVKIFKNNNNNETVNIGNIRLRRAYKPEGPSGAPPGPFRTPEGPSGALRAPPGPLRGPSKPARLRKPPDPANTWISDAWFSGRPEVVEFLGSNRGPYLPLLDPK